LTVSPTSIAIYSALRRVITLSMRFVAHAHCDVGHHSAESNLLDGAFDLVAGRECFA
jgi:hypothetical protein